MTDSARKGIGGHPGDVADRILVLRRDGFWRPEVTDAHFAKLETKLSAMRQLHGIARVLIDLRACLVQSQENAIALRSGVKSVYRSSDRIALVVASSLLSLQLKRMDIAAEMRLFRSEEEGLTWLDEA